MAMASQTDPETTTDLLIIGSGTGMAAALAARELGLRPLIIEKSEYVGGSTARSGGAFWIPGNPVLEEQGAGDSLARAEEYLLSLVGDSVPKERWQSFLEHGPATVDLLRRATPMRFLWDKGYSDYHPEYPGGSAAGRSCECRPFNASVLGDKRALLRPPTLAAPVPMPITGADYKWMNLMARVPAKGLPRVLRRVAQGIGGMALRREYLAGGQAIAAGLFAGVLKADIPVWTETTLQSLVLDGDRVTGAVVTRGGQQITITARCGVILSAGGFDHDMAMRHKYQSQWLEDWSLGSPSNTGDAIRAGHDAGADLDLMDQAWWFPAVAPLAGQQPQVLLAERSLPGSFIVDDTGQRFVNEATDYMTFGQTLLERERAGNPVRTMWLVFDQQYRNSYVFAGAVFPRMSLPKKWYSAGIAQRADSPAALAHAAGLPEEGFTGTVDRFNQLASAGIDDDFRRGASAYDRYYGDPTVTPNPNLRPLRGCLYAVRVILSDLGTCGGIRADGHARALRADGSPIPGLYAIGNSAANAFGRTYPGAGATIGQGLVYGYIAARDAAGRGE
jgi:3-oxosteroid 1-dehydrogenase